MLGTIILIKLYSYNFIKTKNNITCPILSETFKKKKKAFTLTLWGKFPITELRVPLEFSDLIALVKFHSCCVT